MDPNTNDPRASGPGADDPRAVDSRARIRRAVRELIEERGLRGTKIKDVLERAAVARATFYAHFDDKEDAWVGGFDLFRIALPAGGPADGPPPVPPLGPAFEHVADMREHFAGLQRHGDLDLPLRIARRDLRATYADAFSALAARGFALNGPAEVLADAAAGAVLELLVAFAEDAGSSAAGPVERAALAEDLVRCIAVRRT
ncbi:MAG: helix-turn-helix domain-containing protein [Planctomycetota bacterium]